MAEVDFSVTRATPIYSLPTITFFGEAARERGYDLPLPLGAGLTMMSINRPTEISRVRTPSSNSKSRKVQIVRRRSPAADRDGPFAKRLKTKGLKNISREINIAKHLQR